MANNTLINAVIALIEDRPQDAREMLRSPEMRVSSSEVQTRLFNALRGREDKYLAKQIQHILEMTLRADVQDLGVNLGYKWDESHQEAFLQGVAYVERFLDDYIPFKA